MSSSITSRTFGVGGTVFPSASIRAVKEPVRVATTANITLEGEQTIDGIAVVAGDRVLVKNQATASENGIYTVSTAPWARSVDFVDAGEVVKGTTVYVANGSANTNVFFAVTSTDPVVIGSDAITFSVLAPQATADSLIFDNKSLAQAYAPAAAPSRLRTEGFASVGDGGGASYKMVSSEPSHEGKFSITLSDAVTVVWYELAEAVPNQVMFGADGVGDDSTAFQNLFDYCAAKGSTWKLYPGTYAVEDVTAYTSGDAFGCILTGTNEGQATAVLMSVLLPRTQQQ